MTKPPHPLPYFGSKRRHAPKLAPFIKDRTEALYEPFAGSLAMTLYSATHNLAERYIIGDIHEPICQLWDAIINEPGRTAHSYMTVWQGTTDADYFGTIRGRYNASHDPIDLLWLIAASKDNQPRFKGADYISDPDTRRPAKHPERMEQQIHRASYLLKGRTEIRAGDWQTTTEDSTKRDFIFMDPPYQGFTKPYAKSLAYDDLRNGVMQLKKRQVSLAITYDGASRGTAYATLPDDLNLTRLFIVSTNKSKGETFIESLYLWPPKKALQHQVIHI